MSSKGLGKIKEAQRRSFSVFATGLEGAMEADNGLNGRRDRDGDRSR